MARNSANSARISASRKCTSLGAYLNITGQQAGWEHYQEQWQEVDVRGGDLRVRAVQRQDREEGGGAAPERRSAEHADPWPQRVARAAERAHASNGRRCGTRRGVEEPLAVQCETGVRRLRAHVQQRPAAEAWLTNTVRNAWLTNN